MSKGSRNRSWGRKYREAWEKIDWQDERWGDEKNQQPRGQRNGSAHHSCGSQQPDRGCGTDNEPATC